MLKTMKGAWRLQAFWGLKKLLRMHSFHKYDNFEYYEDKDEAAYLRQMAMFEQAYSEKDGGALEAAAARIKADIAARKPDDKTVAIIAEYPTPRVLKITRALKKQGYRIEGYSFTGNPGYAGVLEAWRELADVLYEYKSVTPLMLTLCRSRAFIAHYFMDWRDAGNACTLLRQEQLFPPIVVEHYDVLNGMYKKEAIPNEFFQRERYAFEHAAGVVFRYFVEDFLKSQMGFQMKHCLLFLDYLEKAAVVKPRLPDSETGKEEELSLVYSGSVWVWTKANSSYTMPLPETIALCEKQHCHLHVYPSNYDETEYAEYIERAESSEYFHFHKTKPYAELIEEISSFDYGIVPSRSDVYERPNAQYTTDQMICASTNKVFDYMSAGLPIVMNIHKKLCGMLVEMGVCFGWPIEEYDFDRLRRERNEMKREVAERRNEFLIEERIRDLVKFYQEAAKLHLMINNDTDNNGSNFIKLRRGD